MNKKIAILRGINVGGNRKILMKDLKSLCENLGWNNLKTYIQSGNLIFEANKPNPELELTLEKAIFDEYGFEVPVIIRTSLELQNSINKNPYYNEDSNLTQLHLTFLKVQPTHDNIEKTLSYDFEPDQFKIDEKEVFICCEGKYHKSKLSNSFFEKKLKTKATTRNWKTVLKLYELSKS